MLHAWLLVWVLAGAPDPAAWARSAAAAEQAGDYARAAQWYARVVSDTPESFYARKAQARLADLQAHADHAYVPYARFQKVLQHYAALGSDRALAEARAIVEAYPDSAVAPEALYWAGNEYREMRRDRAAAEAAYREIAARYPANPLALTALDRVGRLLEEQGKFAAAQAVYDDVRVRYPGTDLAAAFEVRRTGALKKQRHKAATRAAKGVLGLTAVLFLAVGGWRVRVERVWGAFWPKAGFALLLGVAPAAFLAYYDGLWSPSLTVASFAFVGYALVLALLASRARFPGGAAVRVAERLVFGLLAPLAIWVLILQAFQLWAAFYL
jgi:TolA-binding protein